MSEQEQLLQSIFRDVEASYGSVSEPNYSFVLERHRQAPYQSVIQQLVAAGMLLQDVTDLNEDVSLGVVVRQERNSVLLQMSYVGPYALLQRCAVDAEQLPESSLLAPVETHVRGVLERSGIQVLSDSILKRVIPFKLPNSEGPEATLYQVLFADTPPPWGR
jgi:hypothetical protein